MNDSPWDNFLKQLVKREYMLFISGLSLLLILLSWHHNVPLLGTIIGGAIPWALYGMGRILRWTGYLAILLWSKLWE